MTQKPSSSLWPAAQLAAGRGEAATAFAGLAVTDAAEAVETVETAT